jgi:hypothetical protein
MCQKEVYFGILKNTSRDTKFADRFGALVHVRRLAILDEISR